MDEVIYFRPVTQNDLQEFNFSGDWYDERDQFDAEYPAENLVWED